MRRWPLAITIAAGVALAGCEASTPAAPSAEQLARLAPADPHLAALYRSACKDCHARPGAGAPLTHDLADWGPRLNQGLPVLVGHVASGYKAMPPQGNCPRCTPDDLTALVRFMAGVDEDS